MSLTLLVFGLSSSCSEPQTSTLTAGGVARGTAAKSAVPAEAASAEGQGNSVAKEHADQLSQADSSNPVSSNPASINAPAGAPANAVVAAPVAAPVEALEPEAQAPAIVAGAYLACFPTSKSVGVACEFQNANKAAIVLPNADVVTWSYVSNKGVSLPVQNLQRWNIEASTQFYMEVPALDGQLVAKRSLAANGADGEMVDLKAMPAGTVRAAPYSLAGSPISSAITDWNYNSFAFRDDTGDARISACYGDRVINPHLQLPRSALQTFTVNPTIMNGTLVMRNVCGMDRTTTRFRLMAETKVLFDVELTPVPDGSDILLVESAALQGIYNFTLVQTDEANRDDYFFDNILLTGPAVTATSAKPTGIVAGP